MKSLLVSCLLPALTVTSFAATPQFSPRQTITTGFQHFYGMAVADFNGDGKADIAVTDNAVKKLFIYLNDGKGSFGTPISMDLTMAALGPGRIVAGDFNEDGKQDLIIGTVGGFQSDLVLIGNGDGTFSQVPDIANSFGFLSAVAVDVDGDHHLDLIVGLNPGADVFLGDGHGGFRHGAVSGNNVSSPTTGLAVGDFNKDGKLDFAAALPINGAGVNIYLGSGDGTFTLSSTISGNALGSSTVGSVAVADFDGDGNQDLLIGVDAVPIVVPGSGNGSFDASKKYFLFTGGTHKANQNPYYVLVAVADMDGDQKQDAVISDDSAETVNVALNATVNAQRNPSTYTGSGVDFFSSIDQGVSELSISDLNGDGLPDIVVGSNVTQNIAVFLSIKPKAAATATLTPSANPQLVGSSVTFTAEITGTGNTPTGTVTLLDGTASLGQQTLDASARATLSLSNLSAGQHILTVSYSGDNNFLTATSSALTQSITDFQIALPTSSQIVTAGGTASYSLNITPAGGLTGSISITCSQLPSLSSCDPVSVPVTGQPATATLAIHTTAPVTSHSRSSIRTASLGLLAIAFTALVPLRRRRPTQLLVAAIVMILAGSIVGCSGASTNSTNSTTKPGTPSGTTQFTITSSVTLGGQTLTRTSSATLVVQ
jgi:hypothetical protein